MLAALELNAKMWIRIRRINKNCMSYQRRTKQLASISEQQYIQTRRAVSGPVVIVHETVSECTLLDRSYQVNTADIEAAKLRYGGYCRPIMTTATDFASQSFVRTLASFKRGHRAPRSLLVAHIDYFDFEKLKKMSGESIRVGRRHGISFL